MKDGTTTKYGWYIGTATAPTTKADQDKYVFLPVAGYRRNDTTGISDEGSSGAGYYWSSTPYNSDNAYVFYFDSNSFYTNDSRNDGKFGQSVRCVRDK